MNLLCKLDVFLLTLLYNKQYVYIYLKTNVLFYSFIVIFDTLSLGVFHLIHGSDLSIDPNRTDPKPNQNF